MVYHIPIMSNLSDYSSSSQNLNALWIGDQAPIQEGLYHSSSHPSCNIDSHSQSTFQHDGFGQGHVGTHTMVDPSGPQGRHRDILLSLARNNANHFYPTDSSVAHHSAATAAEHVYQPLLLTRLASSALPRNTIIPNPENGYAWSQEFCPNSVDELSSSPDDEEIESSDSEEDDYAPVHETLGTVCRKGRDHVG
ncbi:hypothetical protein CPB85DRAFT_1566495 [Mucidula mucida]|nr:hypothetical protein CPB85DRAFT_1566495 [Mucidula mucida]